MGDDWRLNDSDEDIPDWLRGEDESSQGEPPAEVSLPDWLAEMGAPVSPAEPAEAIPDWLSGGAAPAAEEPAPTVDLPDWFAGASSPEAPAEEPAPDWLASLGEEAQPEEQEAAPELDWLSALSAEEPAAAPEPPAIAPAEEPAPDWLAGLGEAAQPEEPAAAPEPDWMSAFGAPAQPAAPPEEAVPDWFAGVEAPGAPPVIEAAAPAEEAAPDWMGVIETPAAATEGAEPDWATGFDLPLPAAEEIAEPDWLGDFGAPGAAAEETPLPEPALEDEMPDWLVGMQPENLAILGEAAREAEGDEAEAAVEEIAEETVVEGEALAPGELPSWIEAARPSGRLDRWGIKVPPESEVPAWAEALSPFVRELPLRPDEAREESAGPLAGLKGALLAEPIMAIPGKPESISQLVVTELDTRQARLLESIVGELYEEAETESLSPEEVAQWAGAAGRPKEKPRPARARQRVRFSPMRLLLSAVLLVALIVPFFLPGGASEAVSTPPAVIDAMAQVEQVAAGDLVLVAFEYGAAEAAELSPGAQAIVEHLADRGARIVTLTTNPIGAIIGHGLVADAVEGTGAQSVDLGYLAGFLGGLRALVAHDADAKNPPPPQFALDYRGEATGLSVSSLRESFRLIVVLPGQYDALRAWLEQVNSVTGREDAALPGRAVPMVAVVGAGVEPVAAAYAESGQLKGYVAGYSGALAYAQARGGAALFTKPEARRVSVTAGVIVAAALIALGNLGYALRGLNRRRRAGG